MNSGGYLPSRFGEVNIHCYSPTLSRIILLVYTTQVYSNSQIVLYFLIIRGSRATFFSGNRQEVNSTWYPEIEEPIKWREKHYSLVLCILSQNTATEARAKRHRSVMRSWNVFIHVNRAGVFIASPVNRHPGRRERDLGWPGWPGSLTNTTVFLQRK